MLDWNGNGRIDPVDIGISIAARDCLEEEDVFEEALENTPSVQEEGPKKSFWAWLLGRRKKNKP